MLRWRSLASRCTGLLNTHPAGRFWPLRSDRLGGISPRPPTVRPWRRVPQAEDAAILSLQQALSAERAYGRPARRVAPPVKSVYELPVHCASG